MFVRVMGAVLENYDKKLAHSFKLKEECHISWELNSFGTGAS